MSGKMTVKVDGQELILERIFKAPKELVFQAFSSAEHLRQWWGPRGWELTVCHIDFRPGGIWHYCMTCKDESQGECYGQESWGKAIYDLIEQPDQIVYTDYFSDADGNVMENLPGSRIETLFRDHEGGTKLISRAYFDSEEALKNVLEMGMEQGITQTWDRLEEHLERA
ncbi:SRPBCC family protein [Paenibacillus sp. WLX2291]|uniref:SRPBCC family protein n=1 Tax=Paenibacillus sp. WLX2291 TaxID=3296934 RepID=UPI003984282C